ncbi:Hyalin [Holothuria leucospilota]|uniref:Hyalin n=1 Tax=Holothuria leucospilota TaxID=206669 RepID=A0A9Q1C535_HOLLE|nr:Hyalin [Holothuria leucospilota]
MLLGSTSTLIGEFSGMVDELLGKQLFARISWTEPFANDAYPPITTVSTHVPGDIFLVGSTAVTYTFSDRYANQAQCSFLVIILTVDKKPPEVVNCPSIVSETVELGEPGASVTWMEPIAVDISQVAQTSTKNPGDFFFIGETPVTYVFTDSSSNSAICAFTVMVQTREYTISFQKIFDVCN